MKLKNIVTDEVMEPGEFEYDCQEFMLKRLEEVMNDNSSIESQYKCYRRGFLDGLKMSITLDK